MQLILFKILHFWKIISKSVIAEPEVHTPLTPRLAAFGHKPEPL
jgi:hypothetical protein